MSISTKVKDFLWGVSTTLQDTGVQQFTRWPEREMVIAANFAQRAIAKYLPQAGSRVDSVKLAPGTKQDFTKVLAANIIPGDGSAAADINGIAILGLTRNMGANGSTPGRVIRIIDRYSKDTNDPDWHTRTGAVVREFVFEKETPRVAYVVPGVTGNVWVEMAWIAEPKAIADGGAPGSERYVTGGAGENDLMGIHDQFMDDAHNYVVAFLSMKRSKETMSADLAARHSALFVSSINAQAVALTGVNPNLKTLPFAQQIAAGA